MFNNEIYDSFESGKDFSETITNWKIWWELAYWKLEVYHYITLLYWLIDAFVILSIITISIYILPLNNNSYIKQLFYLK
jgi:hypothetical protein